MNNNQLAEHVERSRRLLGRAGRGRRNHLLPPTITEPAVRALLRRLISDSLTIDQLSPRRRPTVYGPGTSRVEGTKPLAPTITVVDPRAWSAVLTEGSAGLGRGYVEGWWTTDDPVGVIRVLARNMEVLDRYRNRMARSTGWAADRVRRSRTGPDQHRNRDDIATHYDLGNEFFSLFLDPTMTYSAGVFTDGATTMEQASLAKYDRLLDKLGVDGDHSLLEIGTGWGGLALRAAGRGCRVTTTTISNAQLTEASRRRDRAVEDGRIDPGSITMLDRHWRDLDGRFDRVVSIEMIEAVDWREYDDFFSSIEDRLASDGLVGLQAICVPDQRYERAKNTEDFIRRFVFPGGFLPSLGTVIETISRSTGLQVLDIEDLSVHYAETLRRWRTRFDDNVQAVADLGLDNRFQRLWRFYLAYCEAGFLERHTTVNQIVLAGRHWRPDGLWIRPA